MTYSLCYLKYMMTISSVKKGKASELIVQAHCMLNGMDCYPTSAEDNKVDLIIGKSLKRAQVKTIGGAGNAMNIRKVGCNSKTNTKIHRYTDDEIDCFIGVDCKTFDIYVIPLDKLSHVNNISLKTIRSLYAANDLSFFA